MLHRMTPTAHRPSTSAPPATRLRDQSNGPQADRRMLWLAKTIGGLRKSRFIGREKLDFQFVMTFAAYNLIRMRNLGVVSC